MLYVVLVSTRNPLNIGAAARAMSNFGFLHLRVVNPYELAFREAKSAVGASNVVKKAQVFSSLADAVADCQLVVGSTAGTNRELQQPMHALGDAAALIRPRLPHENVALLFGSEKRGLSADDLNYCQFLVRIPTRPEHGSMNLGQAVAVCLYELARHDAANKAVSATIAAESATLERVTRVLLASLAASDYIKPRTSGATEDKVRRLVRRLNLSGEDAELLLGMLRKIGRKLGL
jgi:TrmH family RNA methyltransferase